MAKAFAKAFYKSKLWQDTRSYILRRDHYTCQHCKVRPAEEIHHIKRLTADNIGDMSIAVGEGNLVALCGGCHKKIHERDTKKIISQRQIVFDSEGNPIEVGPPGAVKNK